ncbi:MAG: hypothetical protein K2Y32_05085 [Candidatus Obscuribacterales bacterium]|nr:hypothetical protein [Candidatus Obscuribacterales bacterium]
MKLQFALSITLSIIGAISSNLRVAAAETEAIKAPEALSKQDSKQESKQESKQDSVKDSAEKKTESNKPAVALSQEAQAAKEEALKQDLVLRAMHDELKRSMTSLKLPEYPLPYFGSYHVTDERFAQISASFGALNYFDVSKTRSSDVSFRVGDMHLDNTSGAGGFNQGRGGLVEEDNYDAIRRDLWMQSDSSYKRAVESLTAARAQLKYLKIEDRPDVFSSAKPVVSVEPGADFNYDLERWKVAVKSLSAIFKEYEVIKESSVSMNLRARTKRLVNSDGTLVRFGENGVLVFVNARAQNDDGMTVVDGEFFAVEDEKDLPSQAVMEEKVRALCARLERVVKSKRFEEYSGPVLFEKQAAGELLAGMLPPLVVARGEGGFGNDDDQKLGKAIVHPSVSVAEDPLQKVWKGKILKSGWKIDYEGVEARPLNLISKGVLKEVCSTRTPTRVTKESNGHNRGGSPSPGHLFISSDSGKTYADLKARLIELGKEDGLEHVYIVRRIVPNFLSSGGDVIMFAINGLMDMFRLGGGGGYGPGSLAEVVRIDVKSGQEELVRGARIKSVAKKNLMSMSVASDDADVYTVSYPTDRSSTTIGMVTPSVLLKDVEFTKPPRTTELPPYLKNPYFEMKKLEK